MKEDEIKIRINTEIKEKFKLLCQKDNITMSNKLQKFIIDEINNKKIIEGDVSKIIKNNLDKKSLADFVNILNKIVL